MKSARRGKSTSDVELTNVSRTGFWLLLDNRELFLSFTHFPWFEDVAIGQLANVERPQADHLYWPDLDVDLAVDSIDHPERYPLVSGVRPNKAMHLPARTSCRLHAQASRPQVNAIVRPTRACV